MVGKYICFLDKDSETLKTTVGKYVTNCNYIYFVKKLTKCFIIVDEDFHGQVRETKLRKDSFEKDFYDGHYTICDSKPDWNIGVGTYSVQVPDYQFISSDLSKSFTVEEINDLLTTEFLGQNKSYNDVQECFETLCNVIMKRHFDYINVCRSYFNENNSYHVGLSIHDGKKYLGTFGEIVVKSYKGKINFIEFKPFDWINRFTGFEGFVFTTLEDLIVKYLTDNKDFIDTL
jgi:hypothetical protein